MYFVLQAAQSVLISLFQLNTPEFSMLLAALPKTFQDGATKLLQNHLKNTGNIAQVKHAHKQNNSVCLQLGVFNHYSVTLMAYFDFFFFLFCHFLRHQWAAL